MKVLCICCDVESKIGRAKSDAAFGISGERSLSHNTVNRWAAKNRQQGRREEGSRGKEK